MWIRISTAQLECIMQRLAGESAANAGPIACYESRDSLLQDSAQGFTDSFVAIDLTTGNVFRFVNQLTLRKV